MKEANVSSAHFWEQCYQENNTGWDLGAPTPIFMNWCDNLELLSKICIPGAGNGYDPLYFASKGHDVTAIDFAESPISRLKKQSKDKKINLTALKNDIFNLEESLFDQFDYIVEYTCYCAIHPSMRMKYIEIMHRLLKKGGELVAILLPVNKDLSDGGPPFGIDLEETLELFSHKFSIVESIKHPLSIEPRSDNEQFVRFLK
jgi:SAM-dependent methyltransferase